MDKEYYKIGEASEKCKIPAKTLRYYDEIDLLKPEYRDEESNYRFYTREQVVTLYIIRKLKYLGFSLSEIKEMINDPNEKNMESKIDRKLNEISEQISELQKIHIKGENFLERLKRGTAILEKSLAGSQNTGPGIIHDVKIEYIEERNLFFIRKMMKGYLNSEVSLDRWMGIIESAEEKNLRPRGPVLITYYENMLDQFLEKDCDVEFAIEVNDYREEPGFRKFGGFKAATCIHVGDYANIINTYVKIISWVNRNSDRFVVDGFPSDEFIISRVDFKNRDKHITRVIVPVKEVKK